MTYPATQLDVNTIPVPSVYVPGSPTTRRFVAMQGSTNTSTDGDNNESTSLSVDLSQIGELPIQMAGSDSVSPTALMQVATGLFNGQTIDQQRGNVDTITLLSTTAVTTTQTSGVQFNYNHRGCIIILTTNDIGTGSVTLSIKGIEPVSSYVWTILQGAAVTTNTTNIYKVYPSLPSVTNVTAQDILPRTWQVMVTANNVSPASYAVYAIMSL